MNIKFKTNFTMKLLSSIFFLCAFSFTSFAQKNVSLNVGDSLVLGKCARDDIGFTSMDLIVKTSFPENNFIYNDSTGEGFFNWFLGTGDFDSRRLPCTYAGRKFKIATIHQYPNEDGVTTRTVILGRIDDERTVIWVEIDKAIEAKE